MKGRPPISKKRFYNYNSDFSKVSRRFNTTLSAHLWTLKDSNTKSDLTWKIIGSAPPFSPVTGTCQLCTSEKYKILFNPEICSLNSRNELFTHCRHKEALLLVKPVRKRRKNGSQSESWSSTATVLVLQLFVLYHLFTNL